MITLDNCQEWVDTLDRSNVEFTQDEKDQLAIELFAKLAMAWSDLWPVQLKVPNRRLVVECNEITLEDFRVRSEE